MSESEEDDLPVMKRRRTHVICSDDNSSSDDNISVSGSAAGELDSSCEDVSVSGSETEESESSSDESANNESESESIASHSEDEQPDEALRESPDSPVKFKRKKKTAIITSDDGSNNSSSDTNDDVDRCPICLGRLQNREIGSPESCEHAFCVDCILEWSKNVNTCPVDRKPFRELIIRDGPNGKIIKRVPVKEAQPRFDEEPFVDGVDLTLCEVCGLGDREDELLLCDNCDNGYHMDCLLPPLTEVPVHQWYCPNCVSNFGFVNEDTVPDAIPHEELEELLAGARTFLASGSRSRPSPVRRIVPRTGQTERIRRRIQQHRSRTHHNTGSTTVDEVIEEVVQNESILPTFPSSSRRRTTKKKSTRRKKTTTRRKRSVRSKASGAKRRRRTTTTTTKRRKTTRRKRVRTNADGDEEETTSETEEIVTIRRRRRVVRRKRRKTKRTAKGKTSKRKTSRFRKKIPHESARKRIATHLGITKGPAPGASLPEMGRQGAASTCRRSDQTGLPTLDIFGSAYDLDPVSDGGEESGNETVTVTRPSSYTASSIARARIKGSLAATVNLVNSRAPVTGNRGSGSLGSAASRPPDSASTSSSSFDLLGSILDSQSVLLSRSKNITVQRDGTLIRPLPKIPAPIGSSSISVTFTVSESGVRQQPMNPTHENTQRSGYQGQGEPVGQSNAAGGGGGHSWNHQSAQVPNSGRGSFSPNWSQDPEWSDYSDFYQDEQQRNQNRVQQPGLMHSPSNRGDEDIDIYGDIETEFVGDEEGGENDEENQEEGAAVGLEETAADPEEAASAKEELKEAILAAKEETHATHQLVAYETDTSSSDEADLVIDESHREDLSDQLATRHRPAADLLVVEEEERQDTMESPTQEGRSSPGMQADTSAEVYDQNECTSELDDPKGSDQEEEEVNEQSDAEVNDEEEEEVNDQAERMEHLSFSDCREEATAGASPGVERQVCEASHNQEEEEEPDDNDEQTWPTGQTGQMEEQEMGNEEEQPEGNVDGAVLCQERSASNLSGNRETEEHSDANEADHDSSWGEQEELVDEEEEEEVEETTEIIVEEEEEVDEESEDEDSASERDAENDSREGPYKRQPDAETNDTSKKQQDAMCDLGKKDLFGADDLSTVSSESNLDVSEDERNDQDDDRNVAEVSDPYSPSMAQYDDDDDDDNIVMDDSAVDALVKGVRRVEDVVYGIASPSETQGSPVPRDDFDSQDSSDLATDLAKACLNDEHDDMNGSSQDESQNSASSRADRGASATSSRKSDSPQFVTRVYPTYDVAESPDPVQDTPMSPDEQRQVLVMTENRRLPRQPHTPPMPPPATPSPVPFTRHPRRRISDHEEGELDDEHTSWQKKVAANEQSHRGREERERPRRRRRSSSWNEEREKTKERRSERDKRRERTRPEREHYQPPRVERLQEKDRYQHEDRVRHQHDDRGRDRIRVDQEERYRSKHQHPYHEDRERYRERETNDGHRKSERLRKDSDREREDRHRGSDRHNRESDRDRQRHYHRDDEMDRRGRVSPEPSRRRSRNEQEEEYHHRHHPDSDHHHHHIERLRRHSPERDHSSQHHSHRHERSDRRQERDSERINEQAKQTSARRKKRKKTREDDSPVDERERRRGLRERNQSTSLDDRDRRRSHHEEKRVETYADDSDKDEREEVNWKKPSRSTKSRNYRGSKRRTEEEEPSHRYEIEEEEENEKENETEYQKERERRHKRDRHIEQERYREDGSEREKTPSDTTERQQYRTEERRHRRRRREKRKKQSREQHGWTPEVPSPYYEQEMEKPPSPLEEQEPTSEPETRKSRRRKSHRRKRQEYIEQENLPNEEDQPDAVYQDEMEEPTVQSKEIYTQGDQIIVNVSFSRPSQKRAMAEDVGDGNQEEKRARLESGEEEGEDIDDEDQHRHRRHHRRRHLEYEHHHHGHQEEEEEEERPDSSEQFAPSSATPPEPIVHSPVRSWARTPSHSPSVPTSPSHSTASSSSSSGSRDRSYTPPPPPPPRQQRTDDSDSDLLPASPSPKKITVVDLCSDSEDNDVTALRTSRAARRGAPSNSSVVATTGDSSTIFSTETYPGRSQHPNEPPSPPDDNAYDPFDPTKSPSPSLRSELERQEMGHRAPVDDRLVSPARLPPLPAEMLPPLPVEPEPELPPLPLIGDDKEPVPARITAMLPPPPQPPAMLTATGGPLRPSMPQTSPVLAPMHHLPPPPFAPPSGPPPPPWSTAPAFPPPLSQPPPPLFTHHPPALPPMLDPMPGAPQLAPPPQLAPQPQQQAAPAAAQLLANLASSLIQTSLGNSLSVQAKPVITSVLFPPSSSSGGQTVVALVSAPPPIRTSVLPNIPVSQFQALQQALQQVQVQQQLPLPQHNGEMKSSQPGAAEMDVDSNPPSPYSPPDSYDPFELPPDDGPPPPPTPPLQTGAGGGNDNPFELLLGSSANTMHGTRHGRGSGKHHRTKKDKRKRKPKRVNVHQQILKAGVSDNSALLLDKSQLKIVDDLPSSAVEMQVKEKFLKKLNRQERVIEEVKFVLRPYFVRKEITKEQYKDVLRKAVPKICHNKSGEINPIKIKNLVDNYAKKMKHTHKKQKKSKKGAASPLPEAASEEPDPVLML